MIRLLDDPIPFLGADEPAVRRLAISVCMAAGIGGEAEAAVCHLAEHDDDASVRAMAIEALGDSGPRCLETLERARMDAEPLVAEALATAYGELGETSAVPWLIELASSDADRTSREAAVAALGAIGDDAAVPILLRLVAKAPPQVRRRAVVALTVFDDPAMESAIRKAAGDRNPSVREAAEMVVGRTPS